jgi:hypothetical protein
MDDRMNRDHRGRRRGLGSRTNAWNLLIASAVILIVAAGAIFSPHDYPAGDPRNEPIFWIVVGAIALLLAGAAVVGAIRTLTRPPPSGDKDD